MTDDTALVTVLDRIIPMINKRREVEVDMEKCKKRNTEHCTKSKFCAIRDRSKIIEPLSESYPQVLVTTILNDFTSYLLAIF